MNRQAIGIFGGTFDPLHFGHLKPVQEASKKLGLTQILLIPNREPVHKDAASATTQQRVEMLQRVCETFPLFKLDLREVNRKEKSYSLLTLQELAEQQAASQIFFFIGMDSLNGLSNWYGGEQLFDYCHFIVTRRPGYELDTETRQKFAERIIENPSQAPGNHAGNIIIFDTNQLDISSTQIRKAVRQKQPIEQLVPEPVARYIAEQKLYQ